MEDALLAALLADAGIAAIVGDRIAWGLLPQADELPALVLHRITGGFDYVQDGRVDTITPLVQVDCWAGSYGGAKTLARAVMAALPAISADPFQDCSVIDERDDGEAADGPAADRSESFFRTSLDVRVCITPNA
ncbi:MAG: DUF3168 domain-containing protein [Caulobacterales bacterium]|nr:DUF3168 domain-containing protein [Caulobacterales bacterium]